MKRILVIGCPGAGKSVFTRKLAEATGLPLHHLDLLRHRPDRSMVATEEFDRSLADILEQERWIIDGDYRRTLPARLRRADTVFFLDYPPEVCLEGAIARLGKPRADVPWKTDRDLPEEFRQRILDYPTSTRPAVLSLLADFPGTLHRFTSRNEADLHLATLSWGAATP